MKINKHKLQKGFIVEKEWDIFFSQEARKFGCRWTYSPATKQQDKEEGWDFIFVNDKTKKLLHVDVTANISAKSHIVEWIRNGILAIKNKIDCKAQVRNIIVVDNKMRKQDFLNYLVTQLNS